MLEGFWFSGVSRPHEIRVLVIYESINDDPIWLVMFPVHALWGHQRVYGSPVLLGIEMLARDGSSKGNKYISAIKVKIQVREKNP